MKKVLIFCTKGFKIKGLSPFADVIGWTKDVKTAIG